MTRNQFCKYHWDYYLVLEKDFLETERYVSIDLGDNYLYVDGNIGDKGNSECFSNEFVKQYQAICSEVDVLMKSICKEIKPDSVANDMKDYTRIILEEWPNIVEQKVSIKDKELMPFVNWSKNPNFMSPDWWTPYNNVKHNRILKYREANLKNVINSLAGLYILEQYLVKYIGDRDRERDVPNDISNIFNMIDWTTRDTVCGKESYEIREDEIDEICSQVFDET